MRLVSATVENFRSIQKARKIPIDNYTVLIGPNNEGKSNLLAAIAAAMQVVSQYKQTEHPRAHQSKVKLYGSSNEYLWTRDYPINRQTANPDGCTDVTLEFSLSDAEKQEFWDFAKSNVQTTIPLLVSFGRQVVTLSVSKQGIGGKKLTEKVAKVAQFISKKLNFLFIQTVRTSESADRVVSNLVRRELFALQANAEYKDALKKLVDYETPVFERLSEKITAAIKRYVQTVNSAKIEADRIRNPSLAGSRLVLDDGTPTQLAQKGAGIQSLATLALMKLASERDVGSEHTVIAIEEPETHLHPAAVHKLHDAIRDISEKQQVILTTHSPIFVDRGSLQKNIIVSSNKAEPCRSIDGLRKLLGIKLSDNLKSARVYLFVEGQDDRGSLLALFLTLHPDISAEIKKGNLHVEPLNGVGNLVHQAGYARNSLAQIHCFLDGDNAGFLAVQTAVEAGHVKDSDVTYAIATGKNEFEFEDLVRKEAYAAVLQRDYQIDILAEDVSWIKAKWSEQIRHILNSNGAAWNERVKATLKASVADAVVASPATALTPQGVVIIEKLAFRLRSLLAKE